MDTFEWETALIDDAPTVRNPHYHCNSQDTTPCPTGEHTNPFPVDHYDTRDEVRYPAWMELEYGS